MFVSLGVVAVIVIVAMSNLTKAKVADLDDAKEACIGSHSFSSFNNLVVPKGQTCMIGRFNVVNGDIKVREGASLIVCPDNDIKGDIKANNPNTVFISDQLIGPCAPTAPPPKALGITIGGDVKVEGSSSFTLVGNPLGVVAINGDVKIKNTQTVEILQFTVNGNVEVRNSGDVTVTDNTIGGDLKIKGTSGTCIEQGNLVAGTVDTCP